jgi:hypothetical protein
MVPPDHVQFSAKSLSFLSSSQADWPLPMLCVDVTNAFTAAMLIMP